MADHPELIIAGGGLAGCLAALALARLRPDVRLLLIEEGDRFGGNHIWSFFDTDIDRANAWLVEPLIVGRWDSHDVLFPRRQRTLSFGYNSLASARLDSHVRAALPPESLRTGACIGSVGADHIILAGGERIDADGVIDARGKRDAPGLRLGWQKFVGREYRLSAPHGLARPIIMDATVDQADGYRFVYCLPFAEDRLLIEDTYYSLSPSLDAEGLRDRIADYMAHRGWQPAELVNEEQGVLPVALGGRLEDLWPAGDGVARIGLAAGLFHPTTGYTLPDAVETAIAIARQAELGGAALSAFLHQRAQGLWQRRAFYRRLNRMLFHAAGPSERYRVLEHFYRLDEAVIGRFYAGRSSMLDKFRMLSGRPPVRIFSALDALRK